MKFTDGPLESFGTVMLDEAIPSELASKTDLMFRAMSKLVSSGCLSPGGSPHAELALDEALTNAMVHGNGLDPAKSVRVRLFADDERWGAIVEDEGQGFDRGQEPQVPAADGPPQESGRGIMLMDEYLDELVYAAPGSAVMLVARREAETPEPGAASSFLGSLLAAAAAEEAQWDGGPVMIMDRGDVAVAEIQVDSLAGDNSDAVRAALEQAAEGRRVLVIEMHRVRYMSSVGLALLVATYKLVDAQGSTVVLVGIRPDVRDLLTKSKLTGLFQFAADLDGAFELIGGPGGGGSEGLTAETGCH